MTSDTPDSSTRSPGSGSGPTPSGSQAGPQMSLFGRDHHRASHLAPQEHSAAQKTIAICGRSGSGSLNSRDLRGSLASRLVGRLALTGSALYRLTWSASATPSRVPICRLAASAHHTDGNGYSSSPWPTPTTTDHKGSRRATVPKNPKTTSKDGTTLTDAVIFAAWPTPSAQEMTTWDRDNLIARRQRALAKGYNANGLGLTLGNAIVMYQPGMMLKGSPVPMAQAARVNPAFVCWLMGIPPAVLNCAPLETPSSRKLRRRLSAPPSKPSAI